MNASLPTPMSVAAGLRRNVIGQHDAQMALSVALVNHLRRITYRPSPEDTVAEFNKENVLVIGGTGCGKTHLARSLAKLVGLPFTFADATKITQAGYVGGNVEDLLLDLFNASGRNLEKAQRGIVLLDEVDKIRRQDSEPDVNGEGVQRALLTLFNGTVVKVKTPNGDIQFDTTNVLFICAGAFVGLDKIIAKRIAGKGGIGFGATIASVEEDPVKLMHLMSQVTAEDLIKFGLIPEFVGRLPVRTAVAPLTEDELCRILTEPADSLIKQTKALLKVGNVNITFTKDALKEIAKEANKIGTGARALQEILLEVMRPICFAITDGDVEVTAEVVTRRREFAAHVAEADLSKVAPCDFSWDNIEAAMKPATTSTAVVPTTPAVTVAFREEKRFTDGENFVARLVHPESGQKIWHVHAVCGWGRCGTCNYETQNIAWDRFVVCDDNTDPLTKVDHKIDWKCEGCGREVKDVKYTPGKSVWKKDN